MMDTNNKQVREIYILASSNFLTDKIPEDYFDMTEEDQNQFLEDHTWQPFEYWDVKDVWDEINSAARGIYDYVNYVNKGKG